MAKKKTSKTTTRKMAKKPAAKDEEDPKEAASSGTGEEPKPKEDPKEAQRDTLPAPEPAEVSYDAVFDAVYYEEIERGETDREARARASDVCERLNLPGVTTEDNSVPFYDLREEQDYTYPGGKNKVLIRGGNVQRRAPHEVTGIVIHQTAVNFSVGKRQVKASRGDVNLALARRALDVACHAMAFRRGFFVAAHDLEVYVNHGNRFNGRSLGLEIDGRYPGLMDKPETAAREDLQTTWRGNPTELTDLTVDAACAALAWLVKLGRQKGMPLQYIWAHRQSSVNRRSDPGEELWRRVVLEYAVPELGLETQPEFGVRGRPIPEEWDPDGSGKY